MIIGNNFQFNKNCLNKGNSSLEEEKFCLKKSIDNLDKRYKNGEIDIEKFKKIAHEYAIKQEDLNNRIKNNH